MSQERVLLVDDDPQIRRMMRITLVAKGFEVNDARTGEEALKRIHGMKYDLVILDINMPGMNGFRACREIRASSDVVIIILTVRDAEKDKIEALEAGADDYVIKPFSMPELLARIHATLRRGASSQSSRNRLKLGDIELDFETREVTGGRDQERLSPKEFEVLSYLASHANKIVTHRELLQEVWGSDSGDQKEYLRVFINRLRKKIEFKPDEPRYLLTEPWVGYRLKLPA